MSSEPSAEVVGLSFPAATRYVRLSRLAAASLAADLDFDVEAVEDLRIAVDEAVSVLIAGGEGHVELRFNPSEHGVQVDGHCRGDGVAPIERSDLVEAILAATTDSHSFTSSAGERRFSLLKLRDDVTAEQVAEGWAAQARGDGVGLE